MTPPVGRDIVGFNGGFGRNYDFIPILTAGYLREEFNRQAADLTSECSGMDELLGYRAVHCSDGSRVTLTEFGEKLLRA
jgi:hypothetical protein